MRKLRIALMGCGRISASYALVFPRLSDIAEFVCAIDIEEEKARAFAAPFGAAWGTRFEDLSDKNIDIVHLCLPHYLHAPAAIRAMEAGMHVLTEKPVSITLQDADRMKAVSERTGKKLGVIFQTRYEESVQQLRRMIQDGAFGHILSARSILTWSRPYSYYEGCDWKGTWDREGGGVLIDQAIHSIDRIRYMLGSEVEWIDGSIHNHYHDRIRVEDTAEAAIHFKNGCLYSLYATNSYASDAPVFMEFQGEKGRCGLKQDIGFYELDGSYTEIRPAPSAESTAIPDYWGMGHYAQIHDFYLSVCNDMPVSVDVTEGRRTLEIVKGIYYSSQRRERIYLPFEDTNYSDLNTSSVSAPPAFSI